MIKYIFIIIFIYSIKMLYAEQKDYEAVYEPLNCVGIAIDYEKMYIANWKFFPTGGSGSEIDIRYNNIKIDYRNILLGTFIKKDLESKYFALIQVAKIRKSKN